MGSTQRRNPYEVLERRDASFGGAAHALVTCHLRDALAPLQAFRSNASLPHYALTELEAGLQRGEWQVLDEMANLQD